MRVGIELASMGLDILPVRVLARVRSRVLEHLDEAVESGGQQRTQDRAQPVDPVVVVEVVIHDRRREGAGRVQRATGEVDACHLGDEEGEATGSMSACALMAVGGKEGRGGEWEAWRDMHGCLHPDRRNERRLVLLCRQHEYGEHQLRGQQHLDEKALRHATAFS